MFKPLVTVALLCTPIAISAANVESLPVGNAKPALEAPHMPSRLHTFVWRNWESVNLDRMAATVGATPEQIAEIGQSMGLPKHQPITKDQLARSYISIIRRNWHLLPYDQLLTLLGWDADQLNYALKEDDFLWHKLGSLKPQCAPLKYAAPDAAALARCAEIKAIIEQDFAAEMARPAEPRFAFVEELSKPLPPSVQIKTSSADEPIRYLYSYFAVYGDPLTDDAVNPYPDGLLQRLRQVGVNGVWMHVVLRQLAPSKDFPEFGAGWEKRLANLRKMVERADRYGIKIYLYMNEPRTMPASFFEKHPDLKGVSGGEYFTMCTSTPQVRAWLTESLAHVFREVPGLGGVFTITASENLTNCWAHHHGEGCPRCSKRAPAEVIAEVNQAIEAGVHAGDPRAKVIMWDWGWPNDWCEAIIKNLPKNGYFMSVSEWDLPIKRGGVATAVGEYSISAVGPGPRATRNWEWARQAGLKTVAKIQANCTWELSAVPSIPALNNVARHCAGLAERGVDGIQLSWTLGGYPSPNLELVNIMTTRKPTPSIDDALRELATKRYGSTAADDALAAWAAFSEGFSEFPYHGSFLYSGPMQVGPANLLYPQPTGYQATMVGFPYDQVDGWRAVYPAEVLGGQLRKVAQGWQGGLERWAHVQSKAAAADERERADADGRLAAAAGLHFASAANQVEFIIARNALKSAKSPAEKEKLVATMKRIARDEIAIARRMFSLIRADSRIGYEASNHYYYYPLDMVEKVVNCQAILDKEF